MRRTRSVPPPGTCRPADRPLAPEPTIPWSRTVWRTPGFRHATSCAIMHPRIPAPTMATAGDGIGSRTLELIGRRLDRPLDERRELVLGANAAQAVEDALAA